jgi:hypothetical protein
MRQKIKLKRKTRSTKNQIAQVYLYEAIGLGRYKIGWAFDATSRCEKLKRSQPPVDYRILEVFNCYNAEAIETTLHKKYQIYKVELEHSQEWFELPAEVVNEVRNIYREYQRQWAGEPEIKYQSKDRIPNIRKSVLEQLAKLRRPEKETHRGRRTKLQSLWSTTNLVLEVVGKTAREITKGLVVLVIRRGRFNTKRRGFYPKGRYYDRNQKVALEQIGALAIAICIAAAIIAVVL